MKNPINVSAFKVNRNPLRTSSEGVSVYLREYLPQNYRMSIYSPFNVLFMLRTAQNFPHMLHVSP